ncbi:MAG: carbohydrate kinase family protein [Spirochaetaceae bacterium]|nr:carbohydrate kinase family protein [Spirochaetaceae bacterium]
MAGRNAARARLLFAGDANLDLVLTGLAGPPQEDKEILCEGFAPALGGSATLTAAAYARLGGRCGFCGLLGEDENGRFVASALRDAGVDLDLLRMSRETGTGVTVSLVRGCSRTQITDPGSLAVVDETDTLLRVLSRYSHLHLSGIYCTGRFLPRVTEVLAAARSAGLGTSLDTQWDPSEEWRHADEWLPILDWLFVNEGEAISLARRFCGVKGSGAEESWARLAGMTARPIIKLGARGACASGKIYPAISVEHVIDPTGAGDSFAAAFLYASLSDGASQEDAVLFAQAAGSVACGFVGGYSPAFTHDRVAAVLNSGSF